MFVQKFLNWLSNFHSFLETLWRLFLFGRRQLKVEVLLSKSSYNTVKDRTFCVF